MNYSNFKNIITSAVDYSKQFEENQLRDVINLIESELRIHESKTRRRIDGAELSIQGEPDKTLRDKVCEIYMSVGGWSSVTSRTTSECGERYGLTTFTFLV